MMTHMMSAITCINNVASSSSSNHDDTNTIIDHYDTYRALLYINIGMRSIMLQIIPSLMITSKYFFIHIPITVFKWLCLIFVSSPLDYSAKKNHLLYLSQYQFQIVQAFFIGSQGCIYIYVFLLCHLSES